MTPGFPRGTASRYPVTIIDTHRAARATPLSESHRIELRRR